MKNLTFEYLPMAVEKLGQKLDNLERRIIEQVDRQPSESDRWFDLEELCNYLPDKPAKATVYGWVHCGNIPYHKGGKKLRFLKSDIDDWLKQGRRKTISEIQMEADSFLSTSKKI